MSEVEKYLAEVKRREVKARTDYPLTNQLVHKDLPRLVAMLEIATKTLAKYTWQNSEYDDDIMTDGSVATDALLELERLAKESTG